MSYEPYNFDDDPAYIAASLEPDEGYWSALLDEGEYTKPVHPSERDWADISNGFSPSTNGNGSANTTQQDWILARETHDSDEAVELLVTGYNRGGLLVTWRSLRGFVPASQLVDFPVDIDENRRRELLGRYVGETLELRIIELDRVANRLILSERAAQVQPGQRSEVLNNLASGVTTEGTVTNLCDFGAFVDLGGVEGLIHISELSWGRVGHPRDVLASGEQVRVYIMAVDSAEERIALSLKRLQPDPWETVEERYHVGQIVEGTITNVVDFGAFARIEEGLEGLVHISELAEGQFLHPRNVVQEGDRIRAKILNIDGSARRLGLSLRQAHQPNQPSYNFSSNGSVDAGNATNHNHNGFNH